MMGNVLIPEKLDADSRGQARQALLRLALGAALLLPLSIYYGPSLVEACLPAWSWVFALVVDDFQLLRLGLDHEGPDLVVRATVMWKHIMIIGPNVIYPDARGTANASTLLSHALQGPLLAVLAAMVWPIKAQSSWQGASPQWSERILRTLYMLPLLGLLVLIDMPLVLAGELWQLVLNALDPQAFCALVRWKLFLQGGGRYALGVALAGLAVILGRATAASIARRNRAARP